MPYCGEWCGATIFGSANLYWYRVAAFTATTYEQMKLHLDCRIKAHLLHQTSLDFDIEDSNSTWQQVVWQCMTSPTAIEVSSISVCCGVQFGNYNNTGDIIVCAFGWTDILGLGIGIQLVQPQKLSLGLRMWIFWQSIFREQFDGSWIFQLVKMSRLVIIHTQEQTCACNVVCTHVGCVHMTPQLSRTPSETDSSGVLADTLWWKNIWDTRHQPALKICLLQPKSSTWL